jgi:eukaryotic-like serine/threonine-protein kinase
MTDPQALIAGRYRIVRALGVGGMGRVWLARDETLRRDVAIKEIVLPFGLPDVEREELRMRTLREARAAARLNHPNVVQIYDVQPGDEQPWIVMEYVRSRSLLQVIQENGALPVEQVAGIGLAVLSALDAANRVGVLHRDVKPSNVLIAGDGRVVLTDFGSALIDESDGAITRTGVILGSPQYIAPERVDTGVSTPEADLWSLGATLYTAVEGRPPYTRSTTLRSLIAITTDKPDPTQLAGPLKPVLAGLLQRNPRARMKPAEVAERLRRLADVETTVHLRHVPPPEPAVPLPRTPAVAGARDARALPAAGPTAAAHQGGHGPRSGRSAASLVRPAGRLTGTRRRWQLAAAAAVTAVLVPLGVVAASSGGPDRSDAAERRQAALHALTATSAAPPAGDLGRRSATPTASASPAPPAPPRFVLPGRFLWWHDRSGYRVAWPAVWSHLREAPTVMFFCAPGGPPTLRVTATDDTGADLLAAFGRQERKGGLPGYRRIAMADVPQADRAVPWLAAKETTWEYEFTDPKAGRLHGLERAFVANGHTYVVQWRTPQAKWTQSQRDLRVVLDSFRPAGA